jgi:hypothetical protein
VAPWSDDPKPSTTPKKPSSVAPLRDKVIAARDKWLAETEADLENIVNDTLTKVFNKTILLKYLGVEKRWGNEYEVERWNGSLGSPVLNDIQDRSREAAAKYIAKIIGDIEFVPSEAEKKAIKSAYKRTFLEHCKDRATIRAQEDAEEYINTILTENLGVESSDVEGLPEFEY